MAAAETMPAAVMSVVEESSAVKESSAVEQMLPIGLGATCARQKGMVSQTLVHNGVVRSACTTTRGRLGE